MPPVAALFPGQGSHAPGMEEPYTGSETFARGLALLDHNPFERLEEGTRYQQPALFLCSVAAWEQFDAKADVVAAAGHSLGEYAALVAAEALTLEDALALVETRAQAMSEADAGGMVAFLGGDEEQVRALAEELDLTIANDNAPGQLVLSGAVAQIDTAEQTGEDRTRARVRRLQVSGAFHSPLMQDAADRLTAKLSETDVQQPRFDVISNGTVAPMQDIRAELAHNLLAPVRFRETIALLHERGVERYEELGPGKVLSALVKRTLRAVAA